MGLMGLMGLMGGWESAMGSAEIEFLTGWGKCFSGQGRKKDRVIGKKERGKTTFSPIVQSHRYERSEILLAHRRK